MHRWPLWPRWICIIIYTVCYQYAHSLSSRFIWAEADPISLRCGGEAWSQSGCWRLIGSLYDLLTDTEPSARWQTGLAWAANSTPKCVCLFILFIFLCAPHDSFSSGSHSSAFFTFFSPLFQLLDCFSHSCVFAPLTTRYRSHLPLYWWRGL